MDETYNSRTNDGLAVASLVLGLLWLGGLGSLLAVIFGHTARGRSQRAQVPSSPLATAGAILGWVGLGVCALILLVGVASVHHPDPVTVWTTCVNNAIANGTPVQSCGSAPAS